jgi:hypothetical protein
MTRKTSWVRAYAVLRVDSGEIDSSIPNRGPGPSDVTVKEVVMSEAEAIAEVARLNDLNSEKGCRYFWQGTHLFANGGSHGTEIEGDSAA